MSKNKTPAPVNSKPSVTAAPQITIDGIAYNVAELSDTVKQQIGNVRVVDQELKRLQAQGGIASVARAAYVNAVSAELPKEPTAAKDGARSAVINGVTYDWGSLGERVQGLLLGIRAADQELTRIKAQAQLAQTARVSFAQTMKLELPKRDAA
jgi:hypothetical protein